MQKSRYIIIGLFVLGLLPLLVISTPTYNYLTKGYADTLYCPIGSCGAGGTGNFTYDLTYADYGVNYTINFSTTNNMTVNAKNDIIYMMGVSNT